MNRLTIKELTLKKHIKGKQECKQNGKRDIKIKTHKHRSQNGGSAPTCKSPNVEWVMGMSGKSIWLG